MTGERGNGSPTISSRSILIVEDNDDFREMLRVFLELEGFRVMTVSDGSQARALLEKGLEPGLILMDVMMPGMTGLEVLSWIRSDNARGTLPVAIMSGSHVVRASESTYFLQKPFELDRVLSLARRHCSAGEPRGMRRGCCEDGLGVPPPARDRAKCGMSD